MGNTKIISHPIPPVWDSKSQILILGTMPSPKSREIGFFYMHPQNRFWSVMAEVFGEKFEYKNNGIKADIAINTASQIRHIICTGKTAFNLWQKNCAALYEPRYNLTVHCLPSTSPANAQWGKEKLVEEYKVILKLLQD